jgi:photosystem II stability/assembly factor-like uncharacterized protein
MRVAFLALLLFAFPIPQTSQTPPSQTLNSGIDSSLRGLSSSDGVLWATGSNGVILRSPDAGKTWTRLHIENADTADFRGVQSFGADVAYVFSVGNEDKSHIYKTTDAGKTWRMQYSHPLPNFFLDGLACRSEKDCFAIGDPIDVKFPILHTEDGEHWTELPKSSEPWSLHAEDGKNSTELFIEGLFAASNSSLILCGPNQADILFATGGPEARIFHSADNGHSWTVVATPIHSGNAAAGIFSIACTDRTVVAVGGDYRHPNAKKAVAAYSNDLGATWHLSDSPPAGYRSAVTFTHDETWIAVGTTGADISADNGVHWSPFSQQNANAVIAIDPNHAITAGPKGTITQLTLP